MAKLEKQYPDFECVEYDYGDLSHREYYGTIHATLKFVDSVDVYLYFEFNEFLDYHKRKKTDFHRQVEKTYAQMSGWGSRYFELIELLQENDEVDLFELFSQFIELTAEELPEKYEIRRNRIQNRAANPIPVLNQEAKVEEANVDNVQNEHEEEEEDDDDDETDEDEDNDDDENEPIEEEEIEPKILEEEEDDEPSPYDRDRDKFHELLKKASNDMFDSLKVNFFPQMDYFQRRYPSKWKTFMESLELILQNFEDEMLSEMLPELDEDEYREFDIKYNSQKADMSDDDEPPAAR